MVPGNAGTILRHIRTNIDTQAAHGLTDGQLLERFVATRDESAFASLMRRHGQLVWGVCANRLHREQDVEDAFQATFMILVRRAATIHKKESVGSWLHGVAYRVAMRAKKNVSKRRGQEREAAAKKCQESASETGLREIQAILNEELHRLPEKYRAPFVLCCLEGRGRREVAQELGWKEGTVSSRIAQAREQLRHRLARRGIALSTALCAAALVPNATARMVSSQTVRAMLLFAAGKKGTLSASAAALAEGLLQSMFAAKLKAGAALVFGLSLLAGGAGMAAHQALSLNPEPSAAGNQPQVLAQRQKAGRPDKARQFRTDLFGDPLPEGVALRLGTIQRRAVGAKLAISRDGKTIVGVREGKYVSLWEGDSGKLRKSWMFPAEHRGFWMLSPFGRWLVNDGGRDGTLTIYDVDASKEVHQFVVKGAHQNFPVEFSPDEKLLGTVAQVGNQRLIRVWDVATEKEVFSKPFPTNVWSDLLAFSPDGRRLLVSFRSDDLGMFCWDIATGNLLWQNKEFSPVSMAITPDGKILSSMEKFPTLNLATGQAIQLEKKLPISPLGNARLTLMPDGRTLLLSTGRGVVVWDLRGGHEPRTVAGAGEEVVGFPDGKTVLTNNGSLQRWDLTTGEPLWPNNFEDGHVGEVIAVAYSADGKRLVSGSTDGTVRLWDVTTGKPIHVWRGHAAQRPPIGLVALAKAGVTTLDISRDGRWILSGGGEEHVELWDASTGQHARSLPFPQGDNGEFARPLIHLRISPDGSQAVGLFGGQANPGAKFANPPPKPQHHLASWDLKTGKLSQCVPIEETEPASSAISPDGRTLVSKGSLIDVATGREMLRLEGVELSSSGLPFAFSPDSALVVGGSARKFPNDRRFGNGIFVWEAATGKKIAHIESRYWVAQVTSHPSGRLLASNDLNGIQVWDLSASKLVATPPLPEKVISRTTMGSYVSCLAFSPDGHSLAAGLPNGTILLWDIAVPITRSDPPGPMELDRLWAELMEGDAAKAWKAIWRLEDSAGAALDLLRERLKPSPSAPNEVTGPLLADLDSSSFQRRQDAGKRLKELEYQAEPALRKALEANPSLEQKRRIEEILKELTQDRPRLSPEELRELRAITVLSHIGLPPARRTLEELTKGPESAPLTRHAKAALQNAK